MGINKTVIINGKEYDAESGLLIGSPSQQRIASTRERIRKPASNAGNIHSHIQRSQTLRRRSVATPQASVKKTKSVQSPAARPNVARSPMIRRFNDVMPVQKSHPAQASRSKPNIVAAAPADRPFKTHPIAAKAAAKQQAATTKRPSIHSQPASVVKQAMINEAMSRTPSTKQSQRAHRAKRKKESRKSLRFMSFATASFAVVALGGYFSYLAMPNLSVRVAAIQSGVDASYPAYKPNGYRLDGPVAYTGGQVSMKFQANGSPQNYTLTQANSNWDSTAVETNYVQPDVGEDYTVTKKQGLTIYTYADGKAAWVNKGVFYSLQGDAPLSNDQVARIATSM